VLFWQNEESVRFCQFIGNAFRAAGLLGAAMALALTASAAAAPDDGQLRIAGQDAKTSPRPEPANVVVVANQRSADSVAIAKYYMAKRAIPAKNLILLDAPTKADITWTEFVDQVFNPLRAQLIKDGWLSAYATDLRDHEGRLLNVFFGNKIDFLVVCYDVPIRIVEDPARMAAAATTGPAPRKEFSTNEAAVDSELALLAAINTPTVGFVPNPIYNHLDPDSFSRASVVRVARLDGPSPDAVRGLIDSALAGEAQGLQGRAYLDFSGRYPEGDDWIKGAGQIVRQLGFDVSEDHAATLFSWKQRFDAPAIYFGWWSWELAGPISDKNFHFPPGAIAIHIHSFSGEMIRDANHRWVGPLVVRGVAATVGNVFEPYLQLTHNPEMFMAALAHGLTTGEAAYYSLPALSWQAIFIGDPLYRPFATGLDAQLQHATTNPSPLSAYAAIRQMNLLQEQGRAADALDLGQKYFARRPDIALAYALAQLTQKQGHPEDATQFLDWVVTTPAISGDELGLVAEIARWAADNKEQKLALDLYVKVLGTPAINPDFSKAVLPEAIALAHATDAGDQAQRWEKQLAILAPPPPPKPASGESK
jgi:uncharacterized protein (TIGR03790 family)